MSTNNVNESQEFKDIKDRLNNLNDKHVRTNIDVEVLMDDLQMICQTLKYGNIIEDFQAGYGEDGKLIIENIKSENIEIVQSINTINQSLQLINQIDSLEMQKSQSSVPQYNGKHNNVDDIKSGKALDDIEKNAPQKQSNNAQQQYNKQLIQLKGEYSTLVGKFDDSLSKLDAKGLKEKVMLNVTNNIKNLDNQINKSFGMEMTPMQKTPIKSTSPMQKTSIKKTPIKSTQIKMTPLQKKVLTTKLINFFCKAAAMCSKILKPTNVTKLLTQIKDFKKSVVSNKQISGKDAEKLTKQFDKTDSAVNKYTGNSKYSDLGQFRAPKARGGR